MPDTDTATDTGGTPFPPITLIEEDWLAVFEDFDGTDAEKIDMIRALWSMMLTFVDFSMAMPSQQKTSGQNIQLTDLLRRAVLHLEEEEDV